MESFCERHWKQIHLNQNTITKYWELHCYVTKYFTSYTNL